MSRLNAIVFPLPLCVALLAACGGKPADSGDNGPRSTPGSTAGIDADADGWTVAAGDCDDHNAAVAPDAPETCNQRDDDCDGLIDEDAVDAATWYADQDGDGYAGPDGTVVACDNPGGFGSYVSDCDDSNAAISPVAAEVCNGVDDDCDDSTTEDGMLTLDGVAMDDLQAAVLASVKGSTVVVCGGSFSLDLEVAHSLRIEGGGAVITGTGTGPVLTATAGSLSLSELSLVGGAASQGGCLDAAQADDVELQAVTLQDCTATERCGGLAGPTAGTTTLIDSLLVGHSLGAGTGPGAGQGGCLCAHDLVLQGSEIAACSAREGGGIWLDGHGQADDSSLIRECVAIGSGGGLWVDGGDWSGGVLQDNAAIDGGGAAGVDASLSGVRIQGNGAQGSGGGVAGQGLVLSGLELSENRASDDGGGIAGSDLSLTGLTLSANSATRGGGLFLTAGSVLISASSFGTEELANAPDDLAAAAWSLEDGNGVSGCDLVGCW